MRGVVEGKGVTKGGLRLLGSHRKDGGGRGGQRGAGSLDSNDQSAGFIVSWCVCV